MTGIGEGLTIKHTDVLEGNLIAVELSNSTTVQVTLAQILSLHPTVQAESEDDAD